jgi:hypothetical protein
LSYLCRKIAHTRSLEIARLLVAALKPTEDDPVEVAEEIIKVDKESWIVKVLLGAFKTDTVSKFNIKQLITLVKKLSSCDKKTALSHCKTYEKDLHQLLKYLSTVGNKLATGVEKPLVEVKFNAELEKRQNKVAIKEAQSKLEELIATHITANNIKEEFFTADKYQVYVSAVSLVNAEKNVFLTMPSG